MKAIMTKIKSGLNFFLSRFTAVLLIAMMVMVLYQVFTRYALNDPSDFTEEIVRYLLVWTGFTGAAYAFNARQHMALIFIREKLSPSTNRTFAILINLLIRVFALLFMIAGGANLIVSTRAARSALLGFPRGALYAIVPLSGLCIIIGQIVNIWEDCTGTTITIEKEEA